MPFPPLGWNRVNWPEKYIPANFSLGIILTPFFLTLIIDIEMEELVPDDPIETIVRKFPTDIVFEWSDITINKEIGKGNFGKVYQGYLDLGKVQR